ASSAGGAHVEGVECAADDRGGGEDLPAQVADSPEPDLGRFALPGGREQAGVGVDRLQQVESQEGIAFTLFDYLGGNISGEVGTTRPRQPLRILRRKRSELDHGTAAAGNLLLDESGQRMPAAGRGPPYEKPEEGEPVPTANQIGDEVVFFSFICPGLGDYERSGSGPFGDLPGQPALAYSWRPHDHRHAPTLAFGESFEGRYLL